MPPIQDHPLRYALANELHARPFPVLTPPCHAAYVAVQPEDMANRDREAERAHLIELLDRFGAVHPQPGATHYFGQIGRYALKWESHTEFVTYTLFADGLESHPFDPKAFEIFPKDWLARAPGVRVTSALVRVEEADPEFDLSPKLGEWFVPESLAVSSVLGHAAVVACDFRVDPAGHMRFAVFVHPGTGHRRVGRIVQRLTEIETYKSMSMLGFVRARELSARMGVLDSRLLKLVSEVSDGTRPPEETLDDLLEISTELENLSAQSSFRFSATRAYERLVNQRIEVLREERYQQRQNFRDFMMRRFDPAMRTVESTEARLGSMIERATRAGNLLRTQVDVARSEQNQKLLESMDRRADLQLRLQHTVEGLSVVAISYYAVQLASYLAYPLTGAMGVSKGLSMTLLTPPVVLLVWLMVRGIRKKMH